MPVPNLPIGDIVALCLIALAMGATISVGPFTIKGRPRRRRRRRRIR